MVARAATRRVRPLRRRRLEGLNLARRRDQADQVEKNQERAREKRVPPTTAGVGIQLSHCDQGKRSLRRRPTSQPRTTASGSEAKKRDRRRLMGWRGAAVGAAGVFGLCTGRRGMGSGAGGEKRSGLKKFRRELREPGERC
jgi:hypothetical protein